MILNKPGEWYNLSISDHRELSRKVLSKEIKKAGLTVTEFIELLNR